MTDLHPLTQKILESHPNGQFGLDDLDLEDWKGEVDEIVREETTPPTYSTDVSGVQFPELGETALAVETTFVQSGSQMQMLLVGTEPVLVVQPEYRADEKKVTFVTTAVDLNAEAMLPVLEALVEATREMIGHVRQMREDAQ